MLRGLTPSAPVVLLATLFVVAACGRTGSPMRPSQAAVEQAKREKRAVPVAPTPNSQNPDKRFILDGLLE